MISMVVVFFLFLILFGFIGAARGWGKELLVVASVILSMAVVTLIEDLLGLSRMFTDPTLQYWVRMSILIVLVFFGYQSPKLSRLQRASDRRGLVGETLLSFMFGLVSGFFVIGTIWAWSWEAGYPVILEYIQPAPQNIAETTNLILTKLPPVWLDDPLKVFVTLVIIFVVVIIYFV